MKILKKIVDTLRCKPSKEHKKQMAELTAIRSKMSIMHVNSEQIRHQYND